MSTIKCPVCETERNEGIACPTCSFESHYALSEEMSEKFKTIEQDRINNHIEWWKGQRQQISDLNDAIVEKEKEITTKQQEYDDLKQKYADLEKELEDKKLACEDLAKELSDEKKKNEAMFEEVESFRKQIEALNQELEDERKKCENCTRPLQSEPQRICYLVHKENDSLRDIHPIYKGETLVGKNPDQGEKRCRIITGCKELQNNHFKIVEQGNGTITAVAIERIAVETPSDVVNPGDECTLDNSTTIYIGNVQLIVILQ